MNRGIRFAGIANNEGKLAGPAYRPGLVPLLTQKASEISVLQSLIRADTRRGLEKSSAGRCSPTPATRRERG